MSDFPSAIAAVRDAVCGILRIRPVRPGAHEFQVAFVGTGWCFSPRRYLATAHHVFDDGKARNPSDKFYAFVVPDNGPVAYHAPVVAVPFEDPVIDMAILEVAPPASYRLSAVPVTFARPRDGSHVLTYGFPSPTIAAASVDQDGNWLGGNLLLKAHANEGIVAAQYDFGPHYSYELNVGWHHGESGGPIFSLEPLAAFAMMQSYRNIQSPHGVVAGPHMGRSMSVMTTALTAHGATIV